MREQRRSDVRFGTRPTCLFSGTFWCAVSMLLGGGAYLMSPMGRSLQSNRIGDIGACAIAEGLRTSPGLTKLWMHANQVGDAGARAIGSALRDKANLSVLHLGNNKISDIGAGAIAEGLQASTALNELGMHTNRIGDAGAQAIGSALRNKAYLSVLGLNNNKIGDTGACAIAEGLQASTALAEFGMDTNQIGDAGAQAIGSALCNKAHLSKLILSDNQISSSAVQLLSQNLPAKCEFSADNQRIRVQDANISPSSSPAFRSNTANAPLAASDSMSQEVRQLRARIAQLEQAQQTTATAPVMSTIPRVSLQVLSEATAQFSESKRIGGGGFGSVYSGVWSGQRVAVKRLAADSTQGVAQFESELEALSRFRHPNIVTIMCYAQEGNERCLVYELMANGSVRDRLDRKDGTPALNWAQRRNIATDIANAMHFVQTAISGQPLFHLDLKTDNVLLDAHFNAKVADFGLTRSMPAQEGRNYIKTKTIAGTYKYICPQYLEEGKVSIKTDVYSYGMILLELLTGEQPGIKLGSAVKRALKNHGRLDSELDTSIVWGAPDCLFATTVAELALACLELDGVDRPTFDEILTTIGQSVDQGSAHAHAAVPPDRRMELRISADLVHSRMEQQQPHSQSAEVSDESISRLSHPYSAIKEQLSPITNSIELDSES
ncbi:TKL/IRAK protein kinase [Capsaspora owczarzaki ATCC 30864]|uniref:TKL/IRAK protein kinase n=1 Tax=Capsaspora owczarzaki (strain ATCC 30864) TaxID=595528 RepID=A0A0D2UJ37_CAPO3|nr:TKL/IRAK protein kinase [Capsaspora owczarzaki ATCC 30864]